MSYLLCILCYKQFQRLLEEGTSEGEKKALFCSMHILLSCFCQILKHTSCLCLQTYLYMVYKIHPNAHKWKEKIYHMNCTFSPSQFRNFLLWFITYRLKHIALLEDRGCSYLLYKLSQYGLDILNSLFLFICGTIGVNWKLTRNTDSKICIQTY